MIFIDLLRKRLLKVMAIAITNRCNLRCKMCSVWKMKNRNDMSFKDFKIIVKKIKLVGIKKMVFSGYGEPLMNKNFISFVNYAFSQGFELNLITNGTLIRRYPLKTFKKFKKIVISLDSIENYFKIRGKKESDTIIKNIFFLKEHDLNVEVNVLLSSYNYEELEKIFSFFKKMNIKINLHLTTDVLLLNFHELPLEKRQLSKTIEFIKKEERGIFNNLNQKKATIDLLNQLLKKSKKNLRGGCIMPLKSIFVLPDGNVLSCCGTNAFIMGNLLKSDLKEMFKRNDEKISKLVLGRRQCKYCLDKESFPQLVLEKIKYGW